MTKHPYNNMGAETISVPVPEDNQALIDWCSWTVKVSCPDEAIRLSGLSALSFTDSKGGGMGYRASKRSGNIVVFYDGSENMGCHISMTGQGCRQFEAYAKVKHCWYKLFHSLKACGAVVTRLDLALDNVDGALCLDKLENAIDSNSVRTRFKSGYKIKKFSFVEKSEKGRTIYLGSPTSRIKVRFYDKSAQYHILDKHWNRCEIQLMAERAQEAVKHLLSSVEVGQLAVSCLNHYFSVVNHESINKSQCSIQSWWSAWLLTTEKLSLTTMKAIKVISEVMNHIKKQYSASFAMCKKYLGVVGFHEFIHEIVDIGNDKLTNKHHFIIECSQLATELPF